MRKYVRGIALFLALTVCGTSLPTAPVRAEGKAEEVQQEEVHPGEGTAASGEETQNAKPLVEVNADAFDEHLFGKGYEDGTVSVAESAYKEEIALEPEKESGGLLISGDTGAVSGTRFSLGTFRFDSYTAGRMILDGLVERRNNATVFFYLDEEKESFASIRLSRQKKKNSWDAAKYMCTDVSAKKADGNPYDLCGTGF